MSILKSQDLKEKVGRAHANFLTFFKVICCVTDSPLSIQYVLEIFYQKTVLQTRKVFPDCIVEINVEILLNSTGSNNESVIGLHLANYNDLI